MTKMPFRQTKGISRLEMRGGHETKDFSVIYELTKGDPGKERTAQT